jgi:gluconokinase
MVVIVMGVTGAGKTTVGRLLAAELSWQFADADAFHSPENVEKMRAGRPLDDADREPWLEALRRATEGWLAAGQDTVLACSALKRAYRDRLRVSPDVRFVYLQGSSEQIERRLAERHGHFATQDLLRSQFESLEEPGADEGAIVVSVTQPAEEAAREAASRLTP